MNAEVAAMLATTPTLRDASVEMLVSRRREALGVRAGGARFVRVGDAVLRWARLGWRRRMWSSSRSWSPQVSGAQRASVGQFVAQYSAPLQ